MKFWQKIFLLTLTVLLISLNIYSYIFVQNNMDKSLENEINARTEEYKTLRASFQTNINYQKYILNESAAMPPADILSIFDSYKVSYKQNIPFLEELDITSYDDENSAEIFIKRNDPNFSARDSLSISSIFKIDDSYFMLTSTYDISDVFVTAKEQTEFARSLILIVSLLTSIIILAVSLTLTRRINSLRRSTKKMAHGIFFMRAKIDSKDEIGGLAEDFNIMADTVENKMAELSQIADDRKRFIDNIAHEMKTPLTSIIGFADLLRKAKLDNKTRVEYADNIYREGVHLKNVSSKLMEIILLGKTNPAKQEIDSSVLLDEIFQSMEHICINAGIVLELQKYSEQYIINVDAELMKSLIYNLIDNAVKASKPESRIILSSGCTETPYKNFHISVKDFGKGIPKEEISKITEPFYMLDKARTREHGGAGLGLALCSEIASLHSARLKIDSAVGEGTEMKIVFFSEEELNEENNNKKKGKNK